MQFLNWLGAHFDAIVALIGIIGGLLISSGYIKDARLKRVVADAVAFADQWGKLNSKKKAAIPPDMANYAMKEKAMQYAQDRLPGIDVKELSDNIEAAVAKWNKSCTVIK
jgi:hypothetical protein